MSIIFVSSTFRDMNSERDAIRNITAPLLNQKAARYGQDIVFCDLRWGVNTDDLDRTRLTGATLQWLCCSGTAMAGFRPAN